MIAHRSALSQQDLDAIAELERRVVGVDGGRLKLEWESLRSRRGDDESVLLSWDGDRLAGFLGLYSWDGRSVELAGMVAPDARNQGLGTRLAQDGLQLCHGRGFDRILLIVPRPSEAGARLAGRLGGVLDHSEHALLLTEAPPDQPGDPRVALRPADRSDAQTVGRLIESAFGGQFPGIEESLDHPSDRTLLITFDGKSVGTVRQSQDGTSVGVYGFAVDPKWQGRGIGRQVLRELCRRAFADGADSVHLEVDVDNEHALGLYTATGFRPVTAEDYYRLPS